MLIILVFLYHMTHILYMHYGETKFNQSKLQGKPLKERLFILSGQNFQQMFLALWSFIISTVKETHDSLTLHCHIIHIFIVDLIITWLITFNVAFSTIHAYCSIIAHQTITTNQTTGPHQLIVSIDWFACYQSTRIFLRLE